MTFPALAETIASNLEAVRSRLERAASRVDRPVSDIRLIAISKTFGPEHVRAAALAGQRDFGENKVQEALSKIEATSDLALSWHLVGHLQSNKARKAAEHFATIHSVDSPELLERLDSVAKGLGAPIEVLVQVDLAHEATKFGLLEEHLPSLLATSAACQWARVVGLMVLPPFNSDPEASRGYFRQAAGIRRRLLDVGVPSSSLRELSMGMSNDFDVAVEEGSTMVRVGTAIFGTRTPSPLESGRFST